MPPCCAAATAGPHAGPPLTYSQRPTSGFAEDKQDLLLEIMQLMSRLNDEGNRLQRFSVRDDADNAQARADRAQASARSRKIFEEEINADAFLSRVRAIEDDGQDSQQQLHLIKIQYETFLKRLHKERVFVPQLS